MNTASDRPLFTPGPLTTSATVKQAMLRDLGSRDAEFLAIVARTRKDLLRIARATESEWTAVPLQGSGTFGIEAVISTAVPKGGQLVVAVNGAYGRRMAAIAKRHDIPTTIIEAHETQPITPDIVERALASFTTRPALFACVHCETTTGLVNPIEEITGVAEHHNVPCFIDSMSAYGALPTDLSAMPGASWLVSSANKCLEGVPGLCFALARTKDLAACEGRARTLSLDLHDQWRALESDGQFRFTPPTHAILALHQAIRELDEEGGTAARLARYARIQQTIVRGLRDLGYQTLLPDELLSPIITSFHYPSTPGFEFPRFSQRLADLGYIIYPGKVSNAPCFRIGSIGRLRESDALGLIRAIAEISRR
jgi:2-aminoethylphosphonate-pyruvate transaminase